MDEQFGGRTDDDLFADEFEPVEQTNVNPTNYKPASAAVPVETSTTKQQLDEYVNPPEPTKVAPPPVLPAAPSTTATVPSSKPSGLSQSRHNTQAAQKPRQQQRRQSPKPKAPTAPATVQAPAPAPVPTTDPSIIASESDAQQQTASAAPPSAPTGPSSVATPGSNTAGPNRHLSGQNPRTKLTPAELEEKMQAMKLQNAERTRKFEKAEQD
jgi:hypothetical protein